MQYFYYPRVSRRILIALLDMFNSIQVYNYDTSGTPVKIIDVPIKYGPGEKYHLFNLQAESGKKYYPKVPSLLMSLESISDNSDRATSVNELRSIYDEAINTTDMDSFWSDVQPAPYDYSYTLEVVTESMDHLFQIFENILPFFNPTNHLRIKEFSFLNIERNLRVKLDSTSLDYPREMGEEDFRYFNGKIEFTVSGYMYRPMDYSKIIKYIKTDYFMNDNDYMSTSTSGLASSASPPADYDYMKSLGNNDVAYTKKVQLQKGS